MIDVLRSLDKELYMVSVDSLFDDPIVLRYWYPTGIKIHDAYRNLGSLEGKRLEKIDSGRYRIEGTHIEVCLTEGGNTKAAVIEELPYPMPKTRKRGPFHYTYGRWFRWGLGGREDVIDRVNLYKMAMK